MPLWYPPADADAPAAGGINGPPLIVRKTADESVTSSTTQQADDALLFAIGSSQTWLARFVVFYEAATAGDIAFSFTVPSGATYRFGVLGLSTVAAADEADVRIRSVAAGGVGFGGIGAGAVVMAIIEASFVNGATAGNVTLNWAQASSDGTATIVKAESHLLAHRIA